MKTTLFMATSINGYVAGENDDTEWVKDTNILYKIIAEKGVCVMGKNTYMECVKYNAFPYKSAINIVLTHDANLLSHSANDVKFTNAKLGEVITELENKGYKELLIVGGGNVNGQFLASNLINEIIIDVHPIIIDKGVRFFEGVFPRKDLEYISCIPLENGMVQIHYKVKK